jgi:hypothetical protein
MCMLAVHDRQQLRLDCPATVARVLTMTTRLQMEEQRAGKHTDLPDFIFSFFQKRVGIPTAVVEVCVPDILDVILSACWYQSTFVTQTSLGCCCSQLIVQCCKLFQPPSTSACSAACRSATCHLRMQHSTPINCAASPRADGVQSAVRAVQGVIRRRLLAVPGRAAWRREGGRLHPDRAAAGDIDHNLSIILRRLPANAISVSVGGQIAWPDLSCRCTAGRAGGAVCVHGQGQGRRRVRLRVQGAVRP